MTLSHAQFGQHLESFANAEYIPGTTHRQEYETAHFGSCHEATCAWLKHAGEGKEMHSYRGDGHVVALHGDTVVDWTHRQFDKNAPVPLVEHRAAFEKRMKDKLVEPR